MSEAEQNLAARYVAAIELEKIAWHALQAQPPGTSARATAWAAWSAAITRTNRAWRQLSCHTLSSPGRRPDLAGHERAFHREEATPPL